MWITGRGDIDRLVLREEPTPAPGAGEVLVRVEAAGVNFADVMIRLGLYPDAPPPPMVPGYEVAGVIEAVGEGVDGGRIGEAVLGFCRFGGYTDAIVLPAAAVFRRPDGLDAVAAAALPVNFLTAWQMLEVMAPVGPGATVLVQGAAGGVGTAAVQLALRRGARVLGSASVAKHPFLAELGVEIVFDSHRRRFAASVRAATGGRGCDVVLEPRHGAWIGESYDALAPTGRLVLFGFADAASSRGGSKLAALRTLARVPWWRINPLSLMNDNRGVLGVNLGRLWDQEAMVTGWLRDILAAVTAGGLAPRLDSVIPLHEAGRAHARLQDRVNRGKIVLDCRPEAAS
jgi:NADPH:quinone reductase-like Zn-dependent oxidoreductase